MLKGFRNIQSRETSPITQLPSSSAICLHPPAEGRSQTPHYLICKHWSIFCALLCAGFYFDVQSPTGVLVSFREVAGLCPMLGACGPQRAPERPRLSSSDLVNGLVALVNSKVSSPVSSPVNLVSPSPAGRFLLCFICDQHAQGTRLFVACPILQENTRNRTKQESTKE